MKKFRKTKKSVSPKLIAAKNEQAMIEGILEGSPDAVGVAVVRMECGCRKMAAVDREGDPASKVVMYRDEAMQICSKCKADNGAFERVLESFIHWVTPQPDEEQKSRITAKVLGTYPTN